MPVKYRSIFWPTVILIAVTSSVLAVVSRTRKVSVPVKAQSLLAVSRIPPDASVNLKKLKQHISGQPGMPIASSDPVTPADSQASEKEVEVEVITVRPGGFEPNEITRRHGPFLLAVSNRTGKTELALRLDRVQGSRVHEVPMQKGRTRWNKILDLPPGDYVLSEQNHPDWICRIKLTPR